jgi:hypothetical protein
LPPCIFNTEIHAGTLIIVGNTIEQAKDVLRELRLRQPEEPFIRLKHTTKIIVRDGEGADEEVAFDEEADEQDPNDRIDTDIIIDELLANGSNCEKVEVSRKVWKDENDQIQVTFQLLVTKVTAVNSESCGTALNKTVFIVFIFCVFVTVIFVLASVYIFKGVG